MTTSDDRKVPEKTPPRAEVDAFLRRVAETPANKAAGGRGRLLFAMDATASREPSWDRAARIQGDMFVETAAMGGLDVQLAFFRGYGEFKVSRWLNDAKGLLRTMTSVGCLAGETQIAKVLKHAVNENAQNRLNAVVYVGDCCEEDVDALGRLAGELGLLRVPVFVFHEGEDPVAGFAFQQIAKLSGGAYCRFDGAAAGVLRELLAAVAVFAAGGRPALVDYAGRKGGATLRIAHQVK